MSIIRLKPKHYSDATYVDGVYRHDKAMERALYKHCKQYFDDNYRRIFIAGDASKEEIFHESFITLWEKIEQRKIYVENGTLMGKTGKPFTSTLTTYFMGISKMKYLEQVREVSGPTATIFDDNMLKDELYPSLDDNPDEEMASIIAMCVSQLPPRCNQILTLFYYEGKKLEDILLDIPSIANKNALKTAKYKCMETLRQSAQEMYKRYMKA